ncbi:MAG: hypothetical protein ACNS60_13770 [Candidatus Cyclobacteriaceae bacterium M2_1C_046]
MKKWCLFLLMLALLSSCIPDDEVYFGDQEVEGFKPIYVNAEEAFDIRMMDVQPIEVAGKLYLYNNLLLINEIGKGIHMIDNTNPANPVKLGFVKVPGSHDMVIKGDVIYANNYGDLIAMKLTADKEIIITERIKNVIQSNSLYPLERGFYFECPDPSQGIVTGWQKTTLTNPQCFR